MLAPVTFALTLAFSSMKTARLHSSSPCTVPRTRTELSERRFPSKVLCSPMMLSTSSPRSLEIVRWGARETVRFTSCMGALAGALVATAGAGVDSGGVSVASSRPASRFDSAFENRDHSLSSLFLLNMLHSAPGRSRSYLPPDSGRARPGRVYLSLRGDATPSRCHDTIRLSSAGPLREEWCVSRPRNPPEYGEGQSSMMAGSN